MIAASINHRFRVHGRVLRVDGRADLLLRRHLWGCWEIAISVGSYRVLLGATARGRADGWMADCFSSSPYPSLSRALSCARLAGVVLGQPDRQAGAALGAHHRYCSPERIRAGPARAEECQSGLSTRVASGERPAAALASPWQNARAAPKSARPTSAGRVLSISRTRGIDLTPSTPSRPATTPCGQPHRQHGQPPPRAGGHPPPRARLHAPHARRRLRDPRRRVDASSGAAQRRRRRVGRSHTRTQAFLDVEAKPHPPAAPAVESSDAF